MVEDAAKFPGLVGRHKRWFHDRIEGIFDSLGPQKVEDFFYELGIVVQKHVAIGVESRRKDIVGGFERVVVGGGLLSKQLGEGGIIGWKAQRAPEYLKEFTPGVDGNNFVVVNFFGNLCCGCVDNHGEY